jgi:hypothetical protein
MDLSKYARPEKQRWQYLVAFILMLWIFGIGYYVGDRMGFKKYDEIEKIKNL